MNARQYYSINDKLMSRQYQTRISVPHSQQQKSQFTAPPVIQPKAASQKTDAKDQTRRQPNFVDPLSRLQATLVTQAQLNPAQPTIDQPSRNVVQRSSVIPYDPPGHDQQEQTEKPSIPIVQNNPEVAHPLQRRVLFNGTPATYKEVQPFATPQHELVYANWDTAELDHNFEDSKNKGTALNRLRKALSIAANQSAEKPALYSLRYYLFKTKGEGREPTLYFRKGKLTGRLRQQHKGGPTIKWEKNKTDYFLKTKDDAKLLDAIIKAYAKLKPPEGEDPYELEEALEDFENRKNYWPGTDHTVANGMGHLEVIGTFPKVSNHVSSGLVDTDRTGITEEAISEIYFEVIGMRAAGWDL
ncbi:MAG: hypothetical protein AAGG51_02485 [Cyanobacteria bacterium P01_G01_bin.54]